MNKKNLIGMSLEEITSLTGSAGYKPSSAVSISNAVYKKRTTDLKNIKNIPVSLKTILEGNYEAGLFPPVKSEHSADGTIKYLFRTWEGKLFETVYIPDNKRKTVCVSTQSGCRMGCRFCLTASYGFHGNLSAGEIVNQIVSIPDVERITHVVMMGMGEPMDNLDNVLKACEILTSQWGLSISPVNITISTVGINQGISRFLNETECNLALSLLSPFTEERALLVPAERNFPVKNLIRILKDFKVKKKRRLSIAYVMINGLNDSERHLDELKSLTAGSGIRINLLPYHQTPEDTRTGSSQERMLYFKHNLIISGISASIRRSRGADISAACGLLAGGMKI